MPPADNQVITLKNSQECISCDVAPNRLTNADDRLPEWMTRVPLPPNNSVFDVSEEDLDGVFNW